MDELKKEIHEIKLHLEYLEQVLESILDMMDARRHAAQMNANKSVEDISKLFLSNPLVKNNPEAAEFFKSMMGTLMPQNEGGET